jgi:uncharacterized membrane protein YccC
MADSAASSITTRHPLAALWRTVRRIEKSKINDWWMALRNALAVAIPLTAGIEMGNPLAAVAVAIGALNVAYSDGRDPYLQRARRMLLWSVLSAVAVFVGSMAGEFHVASVLVAAAWAFAAGMMLAIGTRAGDLGLNTLVSVIVFAAKGSTTPLGALYSGLLVLGGGLLQTGLALLFWPVRANKPQMLAIGQAFLELASEVNPDADTPNFIPIQTPTVQVQETLSALGRDHSIDGERLRLLFDQADRLRLSVYMVNRLRDELGEGDSQKSEAEGDAAEDLDRFLKGTSKLLSAVGDVLVTGTMAADFEALRRPLAELVERAQARKHNTELKLGEPIAAALDVLVGQLRLVIQLATNTTTRGEGEFLDSAHAKPWQLQTTNWRATMRANLTWKSPVFRHAVRLTVCVTVADIIQRSVGWQRAYWIPMTAAVVLKPDFTTTFSRGALRLAGTITGLTLATLIYLLLPQSGWTQLLLVGVYTFFLRYLGPANYGVFTVAISGLIVFLLAAAGTSPGEVIVTRGISTMAGGLIALTAYAVWPTWEKATISDSLADMLEAERAYFRAVADRFGNPQEGDYRTLDQKRTDWRLKRSAAEAAADRLASEPGNSKVKTDCLNSILASSHALINAVMGLEAGLVQSAPQATPAAFRTFANDVDLTLYFLTTALRGSRFAHKNLPKLREDHRRLLESRNALSPLDEYVVIETDRLTVSLNTLREQVARYVSGC